MGQMWNGWWFASARVLCVLALLGLAACDDGGSGRETPAPDATDPDVTDPDVTVPDVADPDVVDPDVANPDVADPDVVDPDVVDPDVVDPDATDPDVVNPDATNPDTTDPDVVDPDATDPDATDPDATDPDATDPDATDPDVTDPEDARWVARPDLLRLGGIGAESTFAVYRVTDDGEVDVTADVTWTTSAIAEVNAATVTALALGVDTLIGTVDDETVTLRVRVGPDGLVLLGAAPPEDASDEVAASAVGVHVDPAGLSALAGWPVKPAVANPASVTLLGDVGLAVFSGDLWSGTSNTTVVQFDAVTGEALQVLLDLAPAGGQGVVGPELDRLWLYGPNDQLHRLDLDAEAVVGEPVSLPESADPASLSRGGTALMWLHYAVIINGGISSAFAYETPSVLFFDTVEEEFVEIFADADAPDQLSTALRLPSACRNAGFGAVDGVQLIVGCSGNFGDTPAAVVVVNLRTLTVDEVIAIPGGSAAGFAWDPASRRLAVGSALGLGVALVDLATGEVLRDLEAPVVLTSARTLAYESTSVGGPVGGSFVVSVFPGDELYLLPVDLDATTPSLDPAIDVSPTAGLRGPGRATRLASGREPIYLTAAIATLTHSAPGDGFANPDNAFGPPTGGGHMAPNASSSELLVIPTDGELVIALQGVALVDGPGADFVLHENVFMVSGDYLERAIDPAVVEVSDDGENWIAFPYAIDDTVVPGAFSSPVRRFVDGLFGIEPSYAHPANNNIPIGSVQAGGTAFDLRDTGLSEARWIRIRPLEGSGARPALNSMVLLQWESR